MNTTFWLRFELLISLDLKTAQKRTNRTYRLRLVVYKLKYIKFKSSLTLTTHLKDFMVAKVLLGQIQQNMNVTNAEITR